MNSWEDDDTEEFISYRNSEGKLIWVRKPPGYVTVVSNHISSSSKTYESRLKIFWPVILLAVFMVALGAVLMLS